MKTFKPEDTVKTCKFLQQALTFMPDGVYSCVVNTFSSPRLFDVEDILERRVTYNEIVNRREKVFQALNAGNADLAGNCLRCTEVYETKYKNICFDSLGGCIMCMQHYTYCNLRCKYCVFTKNNEFHPPKYSMPAILHILNEFKSKNKIIGDSWLNFSGGEPALLPDFEESIIGLQETGLGHICVFSNSVKYSESIFKLLSNDTVTLVTSIDCGLPATYKTVRGADALYKVVDNIIKYKKSGTKRIFLKYIITEDNCNESDLFSFVFLMVTLKPDVVYITPEFPYGDSMTPYKFVTFGARMWYLLGKYGGLNVHIQTDDNMADPKFKKYSEDIRQEYSQIVSEEREKDDADYVMNNVQSLNSQANEPAFREILFFLKKKIARRLKKILGWKWW